MAYRLQSAGDHDAGNEFALALEHFTHGSASAVLHSIAAGSTYIPGIKSSANLTIDDSTLLSILRQLMRCGALTRSVHPGPPLRVEYILTEAGQALDGIVLAAQAWTQRWAHVRSDAGERSANPLNG